MRLLFISIFIGLASAATISANNFLGSWSVDADFGSVKLKVVFNISEIDGRVAATMDSPDQNAYGIKVSYVRFVDEKIMIAIQKLAVTYQGTLTGDTIEGTFTQGNITIPLVMNRTETAAVKVKPQEPVKPYPYKSEDVKFFNADSTVMLAGTFTYPESSKGSFPTVILVSGSGLQDRDCDLMGHKPFLVLADYLTRSGIAVLRCDDRGFGESTGNIIGVTTMDFANDAETAINYLKTRKDVAKNKIGIVGHSEGAMIGYIVAARNDDVAYVVSMAGSAMKNGFELLELQSKMIMDAAGVDSVTRQKNLDVRSYVDNVIKKYTLQEVKVKADSLASDMVSRYGLTKDEALVALLQFNNPWMRFFCEYDPTADIEKVRCPVFALNGDKDLQVSAGVNLPLMSDIFRRTGNRNVKIKSYPGLNHFFATAVTGIPDEYITLDETISPEVLKDIADWINSVTE